ncbi:MAG: SGNH/GDSL hydrolase family protein [Gemmatimonadota bacterium]
MPERPGPVLRVLGVVRDGWLILGIVVLMFLGLEFGYRLYAGAPSPTQATPFPPTHPYYHSDWYAAFNTGPDGPNARKYLLDPYRFHRLAPISTLFIHVDSLGHRFTAWSAPRHDARLHVFLLGGSAMWGFTVRDSFTIPSLFAQALKQRGLNDVEVLNLAESGYNSTQEATTLLYEIAKGNTPDAAVFLDGYNDIATAFQWKQPGMVYDLQRTQQKVDLANAGFWRQVAALSMQSRLIQRFSPGAVVDDEGGGSTADKSAPCPAVAEYYHRIAEENAAIGKGFGFEVFYFMQPMHYLTAKPLSKHETGLKQDPAFRRCTQEIDSLMTDWNGTHYFRAYRYFDQDTVTRFVDRHSHLTEEANRVVAERMADIVAPILEARLTKRQ